MRCGVTTPHYRSIGDSGCVLCDWPVPTLRVTGLSLLCAWADLAGTHRSRATSPSDLTPLPPRRLVLRLRRRVGGLAGREAAARDDARAALVGEVVVRPVEEH